MPLTTSARVPSAEQRESLARALRSETRAEVRFDDGSRALYSTDASNYRMVPIGVVMPRDVDDVVTAVALCREHDVPILGRGGGTSLAGQCCNAAVVFDFTKYMHRVLDVDPDAGTARVQPGTVLDTLRDAAEPHGLTFAPDPSTHTHCTLGGMIGNNSCGVHSLMAGKTEENVEALAILTYDGLQMEVGATTEDELDAIVRGGGRRGEIYGDLRRIRDRYSGLIRERFPAIPRRVSGYNLNELLPEKGFHVARALVGTEGTCAMTLEATVRLVARPRATAVVVVGYPDVTTSADHVPSILEHGPIGLEGIDDVLVEDLRRNHLRAEELELLPEGWSWLIVEFGGDGPDEALGRAHDFASALEHEEQVIDTAIYDDDAREEAIFEIRESGLGATARVPGDPDTWEGWEDAAVPPERLGEYLRDFRKLLDAHGYQGALYGHFGQGCIHTRIDFDMVTAEGIEHLRRFVAEAADLVVSYGGSLSGEHGDGQSRAALLPKMFGDEIVGAFGEFKAAWDPGNRMNPGKVVHPMPIATNLRLGTDYAPPVLDTHFRYPADEASFPRAVLRCVGVGTCRKLDAGTMCPSYMATREEKHSTRGRARLLFELMRGDPLTDLWQSEEVHDALDLCLACKACRSECPVRVDMATYKAEFLSHYYEGRRRPPVAYAMGLIDVWARLGTRLPALANVASQTPGLSSVAKRVTGLAPERRIPRFAPTSFRRWWGRRGPRGRGARVLLWVDTFTNAFQPAIPAAAAQVLEAAGYRVEIPPDGLCCGRPLYDFGMLDRAERYLRRVVDRLRGDIRAGTPVIGLEPSCISVFRNELLNLFPEDQDAKRLSRQSLMFGEFLMREGFQPPRLERHALVQEHCHHAAVLETEPDRRLMDAMGFDAEVPDAGCCGMAGSFGFEAHKYEVSIAIGERVLLPRVREAPRDTLVVAQGFSCREQISQATGREPLHLAQVVRMAMDGQQEVRS